MLLLGDSGCVRRFFVMISILNHATPTEDWFNAALARTRVLIEQTFGILKRRFQIPHSNIRAKPTRTIIYTTACVILHNIDRSDIIDRYRDDDGDQHYQCHVCVLQVGIVQV